MAAFVDFCILCGCDYLDHVPGVGPATAAKLLKSHASLERAVVEVGLESAEARIRLELQDFGTSETRDEHARDAPRLATHRGERARDAKRSILGCSLTSFLDARARDCPFEGGARPGAARLQKHAERRFRVQVLGGDERGERVRDVEREVGVRTGVIRETHAIRQTNARGA